MKKLSLIILIFLGSNIFSQENLFQKLKQQLKEEHPEISFENKLIVLNTWSIQDSKSREANIQLDKALNVYHSSKLKGGLKGVIGVLICKDDDSRMANIAISKDKVTKPIFLKAPYNFNVDAISNIIYDSYGKEVLKNISAENIFESIHQLITR